jgi:catechol 2,3-dioxygenase-like lactoylglutathione lyase family enzyme
MKSKFHHPVPELPVKDVEQSQEFYRDKLGFTIAWTYPTKTIGAVSKDETVLFLSKQEEITPNTLWIFADDVDQMYNEFVAAGISINESIETKPWGIRQFTIKDLDGNTFIFHHDI